MRGDDRKLPADFASATVFAAAISCALVSLVPTIAVLVGERRWDQDVISVTMLVLMDVVFAFLFGFLGACLFLAPALVLAWRRRPDAVGLAIGGACAGLIHALCGWASGWLDLAIPHPGPWLTPILGAVLWVGGFALAGGIIGPDLPARSWPVLAVLVTAQPAAGAIAGCCAGWLLARYRRASAETERSIDPVVL